MSKTELMKMPKKSLIKKATEMGLDVSGLDNSAIADAITEAEGIEADEPEDEPESSGSLEGNAIRASKPMVAMGIDLQSVTLDDLKALRPDLVEGILKEGPKARAAIAEGAPNGALSKYEIKIGPIGPRIIEGYSPHHALQTFMKEAGVAGYGDNKPSVREIA